ncbi:MAG: RNA 2'-phosphotransferase [Cyanobacteria bacterium SIG32]|nr:RNA 2'-phosphotransferase [Cyanobacteria bacterium SIG32]
MLNVSFGNFIMPQKSSLKKDDRYFVNQPKALKISFEGNDKDYYVQLSKKMAYALRHKPEQCGIKLDKEGFADVNGLLEYLRTVKRFCNVTIQDIKDTMANIDKKRFELKGDNIRAYYGHSCMQKIEKIATPPPKVLYHGTSHEAAEKILKEGIKSQNRQFVHMSSDIETATKVGARRDKDPVVFVINTEKADKDGLKFYLGNETTWLSDYIPPEYLTVVK